MKRIEFNELIEKAFSMGYEEAQKEFGAVKRENKKKKREWLRNKGEKESNSFINQALGDNVFEKQKKLLNDRKKNPSISINDDDVFVSLGNKKKHSSKPSSGEGINDIIHNNELKKSGKNKSFDFDDYNDDLKYKYKIGKYKKTSPEENKFKNLKDKLKELSEENERINKNIQKSFENTKKSFDDIANRRIKAVDRLENIRNIRTKKNLKKAGLALAGTAAVASAVYGAKKLYDKKKEKKEQEQQNKKAED